MMQGSHFSPRSSGGTTALSQTKSFLSQYVPTYLENRFNLPQYQLVPLKHRSSYIRTFSISPYIFKKINLILILFGGSLLSMLLYLLGFFRRRRLSIELSKQGRAPQANSQESIEGHTPAPIQDQYITLEETDKHIITQIQEKHQLQSIDTSTKQNLFATREMGPLLNYISMLQNKIREEEIVQDAGRILEDIRTKQTNVEENVEQEALNNEKLDHGKDKDASASIENGAMPTPKSFPIEKSQSRFSIAREPKDRRTQSFQNLISRHFDRMSKIQRQGMEVNNTAPHTKTANRYTIEHTIGGPGETKPNKEDHKNYMQSLIDEFTLKDREFGEYCSKLLLQIDRKYTQGKS